MPNYKTGVTHITLTKQEDEIRTIMVDPDCFILTFHRTPPYPDAANLNPNAIDSRDIVIKLKRPFLDDLLVELVSVLNGEDSTPLCIVDCNEMGCKNCNNGKCTAGTIALTEVDDSPVMGLLTCQEAIHAAGRTRKKT